MRLQGVYYCCTVLTSGLPSCSSSTRYLTPLHLDCPSAFSKRSVSHVHVQSLDTVQNWSQFILEVSNERCIPFLRETEPLSIRVLWHSVWKDWRKEATYSLVFSSFFQEQKLEEAFEMTLSLPHFREKRDASTVTLQGQTGQCPETANDKRIRILLKRNLWAFLKRKQEANYHTVKDIEVRIQTKQQLSSSFDDINERIEKWKARGISAALIINEGDSPFSCIWCIIVSFPYLPILCLLILVNAVFFESLICKQQHICIWHHQSFVNHGCFVGDTNCFGVWFRSDCLEDLG